MCLLIGLWYEKLIRVSTAAALLGGGVGGAMGCSGSDLTVITRGGVGGTERPCRQETAAVEE